VKGRDRNGRWERWSVALLACFSLLSLSGCWTQRGIEGKWASASLSGMRQFLSLNPDHTYDQLSKMLNEDTSEMDTTDDKGTWSWDGTTLLLTPKSSMVTLEHNDKPPQTKPRQPGAPIKGRVEWETNNQIEITWLDGPGNMAYQRQP